MFASHKRAFNHIAKKIWQSKQGNTKVGESHKGIQVDSERRISIEIEDEGWKDSVSFLKDKGLFIKWAGYRPTILKEGRKEADKSKEIEIENLEKDNKAGDAGADIQKELEPLRWAEEERLTALTGNYASRESSGIIGQDDMAYSKETRVMGDKTTIMNPLEDTVNNVEMIIDNSTFGRLPLKEMRNKTSEQSQKLDTISPRKTYQRRTPYHSIRKEADRMRIYKM
ncbi:hypothetical protein SUGI_0938370 [Cryptomeria japonica]|nr:hypothetical protein SUGI_0938370 [Cryptomeria japonica]